MRSETLRDRLNEFHEQEGISYKYIANYLEVSIGVMYNFTSGIRDLKPQVRKDLEEYLEDMGY